MSRGGIDALGYICLTVFLFCVSLLPPAYLRYYPFRSIAGLPTRRFLIGGHLIIFLLEFILLSLLFYRGMLTFDDGVFQKLYYFCYMPHFLLLIFTIRPYWFRHLFVLGLQAIYMISIHTLALEVFKLLLPQAWMFNRFHLYFVIYLTLFLLGMPLMMRILRQLFTSRQLLGKRPSFWMYLGPVPLLLCYYHGNAGYMTLDPSLLFLPSIQLYTVVTRGVLLLVGLFLVVSIRDGILQVQKMFSLKERNLQLQEQLTQLNDYAVSLRQEQKELVILRHDSRHQLRMLAELVENGHYREAEQLLLRLQEEMVKK